MINLIKLSFCPETLWKNGKGKTRQIDIFPKNATVANNDFLWRLSSAQVSASDPFSIFPGCDRLVVVWQGAGLLLNNKKILPHSPTTFSGEESIHCDLINDHVIDLGLIFKRDQIKASMETITLLGGPLTLKLKPALHFIFMAEGKECLINAIKVVSGDVLKVENESELTIHSELPSIFYKISINEISTIH